MRVLKTNFVLVICFCLCLAGLLFVALRPLEAAVSADQPLAQQDLEQQLTEAEQNLAEHRQELAALLRAYYMGHAGEGETKRLIEQVEEERLYVEELRGMLENKTL